MNGFSRVCFRTWDGDGNFLLQMGHVLVSTADKCCFPIAALCVCEGPAVLVEP